MDSTDAIIVAPSRHDLLVIERMLTDLECETVRVRAGEQGFGPARLLAEGRLNDETFMIDPELADGRACRLEPLALVGSIEDGGGGEFDQRCSSRVSDRNQSRCEIR
jgi:hypothetical protein